MANLPPEFVESVMKSARGQFGKDALDVQAKAPAGVWLITPDQKARYLHREAFKAVVPDREMRESIWTKMQKIDRTTHIYIVLHLPPDFNWHFALNISGGE